jgi:anti-anti-sigma regulatory factor
MADLATVDALARLCLVARRAGLRFAIVDAPADLRELIELTGLAAVLGLEPRRQTEEREERLRVEEERELDQPAF